MNNAYNGEMMKIGKSGEDRLFFYLQSKYGRENVVKLTNDSSYFKKDCDFLVLIKKQNNTEKIYIELKTDSYIAKTENLAFELYRIYLKKFFLYEGWGTRSVANKLFVMESIQNYVYSFDFYELRFQVSKYISENLKPKFVSILTDSNKFIRCSEDVNFDSDELKMTCNILVPLKNLTYKKFKI